VADLDRSIELDRDNAFALSSRGDTKRQLGRYEEALADFERAIELNAEDDWDRYQRGITRRRVDAVDAWLEDLNAAVAIATEAYQVTPTGLQNLFNLALYHVARGDAEEAEARYREGLALPPDSVIYREAIADLEQYLSLFPDDALADRMLALLAASRDA
jgi:tetratricopeptide (TPR) repeat protein